MKADQLIKWNKNSENHTLGMPALSINMTLSHVGLEMGGECMKIDRENFAYKLLEHFSVHCIAKHTDCHISYTVA